MELFFSIPLFIVALIILVKASDYFVVSVAKIAKLFGISEFVIGMSIVAIGTSLPELITSLIAAGVGTTEFVVGNVVGSNIANIGLILGLAATIAVLHIKTRIYREDAAILAVVTLMFFFFALNGAISRFEGIILIVLFFAYLLYLFKFQQLPKKEEKVIEKGGFKIKSKLNKATFKELAISAVSLVFLIYAAKLVVQSATDIATVLAVPVNVIAVTMIALGTSLPELVVGISALRKGMSEMLIGNIMGSNIMNILLIGGLSSVIKPLLVNSYSLLLTIPVMILLTALLMWFMRSQRNLVRWEGITLMTVYVLFIVAAWIFVF